MNYVIHSHIIYYVEPIGICHENLLLLLLLSDARSQEEEENTQFAGEQIALQKEVDGVTAVPVAGKEPSTATATTATTATIKPLQPCPQGRERQLTHYPLMRRKYTVRLIKTPSNNTKTLQRDEEASVKAKNRLLTR
jgi:hypothetical protein